MSPARPTASDPGELQAHWISPGDSVRLCVLSPPSDICEDSYVFEIWDPGGAQPFNSHPESVETFFFLAGEGVAICDDHRLEVRPGTLLVLPRGSRHRIINTGEGPMYSLTMMAPDAGFTQMIESGPEAPLYPQDLAVLTGSGRAAGRSPWDHSVVNDPKLVDDVDNSDNQSAGRPGKWT